MQSDTVILAFDTSAAHCAAALLCGDQIVTQRVEDMTRGQGERLVPMLEEVLAEAGFDWADLKAIGVGVGPGNFTGIRLSVAAARGLALSLGIPAIGVSTLEAAVLGALQPSTAIVAAPRGRAYVQTPDAAPTLMEADVIPAQWPIFGYEGAGQTPLFPLPEAIARMAATRMSTGQPRPAPLYLRAADAAPPSDPPPLIIP